MRNFATCRADSAWVTQALLPVSGGRIASALGAQAGVPVPPRFILATSVSGISPGFSPGSALPGQAVGVGFVIFLLWGSTMHLRGWPFFLAPPFRRFAPTAMQVGSLHDLCLARHRAPAGLRSGAAWWHRHSCLCPAGGLHPPWAHRQECLCHHAIDRSIRVLS
jgi:hypothetical protein